MAVFYRYIIEGINGYVAIWVTKEVSEDERLAARNLSGSGAKIQFGAGASPKH